MISGEMITNCGYLVTFLGEIYYFWGQIYHFYGCQGFCQDFDSACSVNPSLSGEPYSRADHPLLIRLGHPLLIVHPPLVDDDGQDAQ